MSGDEGSATPPDSPGPPVRTRMSPAAANTPRAASHRVQARTSRIPDSPRFGPRVGRFGASCGLGPSTTGSLISERGKQMVEAQEDPFEVLLFTAARSPLFRPGFARPQRGDAVHPRQCAARPRCATTSTTCQRTRVS